jgi:peptidyl-prolyl cis-trans isomerase A (cyclophilin A)
VPQTKNKKGNEADQSKNFRVPRPPDRALWRLTTLLLIGSVAGACARRASLLEPGHAQFTAAAPDSFDVEMVTTKGTLVVRARRAWAPHGVDRFHALVRSRYFDGVAFHRTMRNFVAQFGIHGDTAVSRAWNDRTIPDDSVRAPNRRGTLAFARGGRNTRSTQLFFNLVSNSPRLDTLNGFGFPPIGEIVQGLAVVDSLNWEYTGTRGGQTFPGPSQDSLRRQGNAYLHRKFPRLDYIVRARIARSWKR